MVVLAFFLRFDLFGREIARERTRTGAAGRGVVGGREREKQALPMEQGAPGAPGSTAQSQDTGITTPAKGRCSTQ